MGFFRAADPADRPPRQGSRDCSLGALSLRARAAILVVLPNRPDDCYCDTLGCRGPPAARPVRTGSTCSLRPNSSLSLVATSRYLSFIYYFLFWWFRPPFFGLRVCTVVNIARRDRKKKSRTIAALNGASWLASNGARGISQITPNVFGDPRRLGCGEAAALRLFVCAARLVCDFAAKKLFFFFFCVV